MICRDINILLLCKLQSRVGFALKLVYELVYLNFHSMLIIFSTFLFCIGSFSAFMTQLHFALYVHGPLCFGVLWVCLCRFFFFKFNISNPGNFNWNWVGFYKSKSQKMFCKQCFKHKNSTCYLLHENICCVHGKQDQDFKEAFSCFHCF